jgi:hypothetical protein
MSVSVVYRYWQPNTHDHLYTTNAAEIGTTQQGQTGNHGYTCEGEAFTVFNHHHAGLVPVYRYWQESTHDHLYTANPNEIGTTHVGQTGNHGYKCEGVLGYVSPVEFPGSVAIHRYWNPNTKDHLYTVKAEEIGTTHVGHTGNHGYSYEGPVGYLTLLNTTLHLSTDTGTPILMITSTLTMLLKLELPLVDKLETMDTPVKELLSTFFLITTTD